MSEEFNFEDAWNNQAARTEFEPIPDGKYHAQITKATFVEKKDGKPAKVQWEYTITDSGKFEKRKVWENNQISQKGMFFLRRNLDILGLSEGVKSTSDIVGKLEYALNKRVVLTITQRTFNDKIYNNGQIDELITIDDELGDVVF